jgi:hypothetical protein
VRRIEPKVFLVGESQPSADGMKAYLDHVGAPEWTTDAPSGGERLTENEKV